jgi:hypothetical protein
MQEAIFGVLQGEQWVGYRVRAATHRIVQRGESRSEVLEQGSAYSVGTVRCYRPSTGEHLVVFDDPLLQPQWLECKKSTIDVLFSCSEANAAPGAGATASGSSSNAMICAPCGDKADTNYSHQTDCVLCDVPLNPGTFKQCETCGMKCHTYCTGEDFGKTVAGTSSASAQHWATSTVVPWKCWNCIGEPDFLLVDLLYYLTVPVVDWSAVCFGCGANSWDKSLLAWNIRRVESEAPDMDMLVCGDCLYRYKYVKDFCPCCFKPYATDESMLPLVPIDPSQPNTVSPDAASEAVVAPIEQTDPLSVVHDVGGDEMEVDAPEQDDATVEEEPVVVEGVAAEEPSAAAGDEAVGLAEEGEGSEDEHEETVVKPPAPPQPSLMGLTEENMVSAVRVHDCGGSISVIWCCVAAAGGVQRVLPLGARDLRGHRPGPVRRHDPRHAPHLGEHPVASCGCRRMLSHGRVSLLASSCRATSTCARSAASRSARLSSASCASTTRSACSQSP